MIVFFSSFLLTIISYFTTIALVYSLIPKDKKEEKKVYIHTAIIDDKKAKVIKEGNKQITKITQTSKKKVEKTAKKKLPKKGSKTNITKGGKKIGYNDIFESVDYNVTTKKVVLKAQSDMSRFKGVESNLKSVKIFNISLVQNSGKKLTDKEYSEIESKLYNVWNNVSTIPIDYAKVVIKNIDGKIYVTILDTNLDLDKQNELINKIEQEKFNKEFDVTVSFQSKGHND